MEENMQEELIENVELNAVELENQQNNANSENQTSGSELEAMNAKCSELNDKNLRLMAEFDNYRKRALKERMDLIKSASETVLIDMLPLVDDLERAMKAMEVADDIVAVKEGVQLIHSKFISFLQQKGVKEIPTSNEVFNTDLHEAITTFPAPSEDLKGKIIDCATKGYTLHEKVIRFSKVVVGE